MSLNEMVFTFLSEVKNTKWQEWISVVTQVLSVWYAKKNNILVYPTGIVGVLLAAWLYYFIASPPLYADAILNIYYFIMSVYGWYSWSLKKDEEVVYPISYCNKSELVQGFILFLISWLGIYFLLMSNIQKYNYNIN